MKKIFLILVLAAILLPSSLIAQDARQRTTTTIIADALDRLPASTQDDYNSLMNELASTGADGIAQLAGMLVPAGKGKNAAIEYALNGVACYVTRPDKVNERTEVRKGLAQAIERCTDNPNRAFLMTMLQHCATAEDAPVFVKYLNDAYLAEWAIDGLAHTEGTDEALLKAIREGATARERLAYAAGIKNLKAAEPILLNWLKTPDIPTQKAIYHALSICGSSASLPALRNAADSPAYYLKLLKTMVANGEGKAASSAAKALMKATDKAYIRGAALDVIVAADGKKALPSILDALKDNNRAYRVNALRLSESIADESFYATLAKTLKAKDDKEVKADILNWFGTNHIASQIDAVVANMHSGNKEVALAAIAAAGKIGGNTAMNALIAELDGNHADAAIKALLSFNGKVNGGIMAALDGNKPIRIAALGIASTRRMNEAADKVFVLLESPDSEISAAACKTLAGVVGASDFNRLSLLIEKASGGNIPLIQEAMKNAILALPGNEQYATVMPHFNKSANPSLYYPVLAQAGNTEAIAEIMKGYNGSYRKEALASLLQVDNTEMIDILYPIAVEDKENAQTVLSRYTSLVAESVNTPEQKYQLYSKALEIATDVNVQKRLISLLGATHTYQALLLVEAYMDNKATAETAAEAVRTIVSKNDGTFGGAPVRRALEKAIACFKEAGHADAGYAIDDINGMLQRLPESMHAPSSTPKFELSAEEAKEGFEVLFDGISMHQWTGNTTDYVPIDGTLYVTAQYGGSGNLYTVKKYGDFVLRFEFAFMREGVNNGVGIRTPMGVDAAYEGMEIQILDHDAPIYKNLQVYQQHGSVYGIIPAKRVKFPALGEWNTEEIRAVGDRITVTLNGEVILDGNIREACRGHNVSPDGAKTNPYTVDKKNHPGLFNKEGHIGFLGHGTGLGFRNIRIKEIK